MLKILRRKGVSKTFLWIIAVGIIVMFGFGGQAYLLRGRGGEIDYAGKIFGKKISIEEYERNYQRAYLQAFMRYGQNINKIRDYLNLESDAWDRIILLHEAQKRKIHIPNEEVVQAIQSYDFFQVNGQFNPERYYTILRHGFKIKERDFEEGLRDSLKFTKIFEQETENITVPEQEILENYKQKNEKIQVSYLLFAQEKFLDKVAYDEPAAKAYYESHLEEFQTAPQANVEYITFPFNAEISTEEKEALKEKADRVRGELNSSADLASIAQKYQLETKTSGFFDMSEPQAELGWSFPVLQLVHELDVGEISDPIEIEQGYQILKILEKKEPAVPPYENIKDKVKTAWSTNAAKILAKQEAEKHIPILKEKFVGNASFSLQKTAEELGLEIEQTPLFNRGQYLPLIGISKDFQDAAFSLTPQNPLSEVVEIPRGYGILHLDTILPFDEKDFAAQKERINQELLTQRKNTAFNNFLSQLRLKANLVDHISELLARKEKQAKPGNTP